MGKPLEIDRHNNATDETIRSWFEKVILPLHALHQYKPWMIANTDETMVQINTKKTMKIVVPRLNGYKRFVEEPNLAHITFVSTVFANGDHARTLIIYPSKTLPKELSLEDVLQDPGFVVTGRSGGWIDKDLFEQYCRTVVIPFYNEQRIRHKQPHSRGLFLVDGHSSRWNVTLMQEFANNHIDVVTLVSHTSHICQPLDSLVFGTFKTTLRKELKSTLRRVRRHARASQSINDILVALGVSQPDDGRAIMDSDDEANGTGPESSSVAGNEAADDSNFDPLLSSTLRRYILVETAKHALHIAYYRDTIRKSFAVTGLGSPPSLENALKRDGIRVGPDMLRAESNIANTKKRKRVSINGTILTSEESLSMLKKEEERLKAAAEQKAAKRARHK
jgi:hypothetical protein